MTVSADFRFACAAGQKHIGEGYTQEIVKAINLSPREHHSRHVSRTQKVLCERRLLMKTSVFKKDTPEIKKELRTGLRHQKENIEGITHESNCAFLTKPAVPRIR
jgi:hypothetical protein